MNTEEMFKILMSKIDSNHKQVMEKIDVIAADVAEIKEDVHLLKELDEIDTLSINAAFNDIKEIKEKVNNLDKQSNIVRVLDKSVPSLQVRLSDLEDEVAQIKRHLDKAS